MRKSTTLLLFLLLLGSASKALLAEDITGRWWTEEKDTLIQISADASGTWAGKIILGPKPDERDVHNPKPELRQRPLMGLVILQGFVRDSPLKWKGGTIYDPESGNVYKAIIWLEKGDDAHLKLKGYVGIPLFGRTSQWTKEPESK